MDSLGVGSICLRVARRPVTASIPFNRMRYRCGSGECGDPPYGLREWIYDTAVFVPSLPDRSLAHCGRFDERAQGPRLRSY
jgi:hypothetical protein